MTTRGQRRPRGTWEHRAPSAKGTSCAVPTVLPVLPLGPAVWASPALLLPPQDRPPFTKTLGMIQGHDIPLFMLFSFWISVPLMGSELPEWDTLPSADAQHRHGDTHTPHTHHTHTLQTHTPHTQTHTAPPLFLYKNWDFFCFCF